MRVSHVAAPVRAQTVHNLRNAILEGRFAPGEKLVEADLCDLLGVSRPSVREALRQLEAEKLVVITPYKGPSVARVSWEEARQIYEVRSLLEGHAAYLFATLARPEELEAMERALSGFEEAAKKGDAVRRLSHTAEFYAVMLEGCGNAVVRDLLDGLHARITFLRARSMSRTGRSKQSVAEMRAILSALRACNADRARKASIEHVRRACESAKAGFPDADPGADPAGNTAPARRRVTKTARHA